MPPKSPSGESGRPSASATAARIESIAKARSASAILPTVPQKPAAEADFFSSLCAPFFPKRAWMTCFSPRYSRYAAPIA